MDGQLRPELIWRRIQQSNNYEEIVDLSNKWYPLVVKGARKLKVAPSGPRESHDCHRIFISNQINAQSVGICYSSDSYHGPAIRVVPANRMIRERTPLFDTLRETILHEAQHAIDETFGLWSDHHNHWYQKRLERLRKLYPPSLL